MKINLIIQHSSLKRLRPWIHILYIICYILFSGHSLWTKPSINPTVIATDWSLKYGYAYYKSHFWKHKLMTCHRNKWHVTMKKVYTGQKPYCDRSRSYYGPEHLHQVCLFVFYGISLFPAWLRFFTRIAFFGFMLVAFLVMFGLPAWQKYRWLNRIRRREQNPHEQNQLCILT